MAKRKQPTERAFPELSPGLRWQLEVYITNAPNPGAAYGAVKQAAMEIGAAEVRRRQAMREAA